MYKVKIGAEEKLKAVEAYESGEMSFGEVVAVYKIRASTFQSWIRNYKVFGREGLLPKSKQKAYSRELKIAAVQEYLGGGGSHAEICRKYKIY